MERPAGDPASQRSAPRPRLPEHLGAAPGSSRSVGAPSPRTPLIRARVGQGYPARRLAGVANDRLAANLPFGIDSATDDAHRLSVSRKAGKHRSTYIKQA